MVNGDMPDDDATGGSAPGEGDEAAWLDLVARFDAPAPEHHGGDAPWPERENLAGAVRAAPAGPDAPAAPDALPADTPAGPPGNRPASPGGTTIRFGAGHGPRDAPIPDSPEDNHYVPPPPPPLPKVGTVTKLAWLALFAGPCYLLIATAVGWTVSAVAAFGAVAAFVGGFAVLVIRMGNGGPGDSGPDDGAVV